MKSVGISYFKEHCLELLAQLDAEGLVVTQDGKPIAKVIPHEEPIHKQQDDEWEAGNLKRQSAGQNQDSWRHFFHRDSVGC